MLNPERLEPGQLWIDEKKLYASLPCLYVLLRRSQDVWDIAEFPWTGKQFMGATSPERLFYEAEVRSNLTFVGRLPSIEELKSASKSGKPN